MAEYDEILVIGNDMTYDMEITDAAGAPVDLTGCAFACELRDYPGGNLLATPTVTAVDLANGKLRITIPKTATSTLTPQKMVVMDVKITWPDGKVENYGRAKGLPWKLLCVRPVTQ